MGNKGQKVFGRVGIKSPLCRKAEAQEINHLPFHISGHVLFIEFIYKEISHTGKRVKKWKMRTCLTLLLLTIITINLQSQSNNSEQPVNGLFVTAYVSPNLFLFINKPSPYLKWGDSINGIGSVSSGINLYLTKNKNLFSFGVMHVNQTYSFNNDTTYFNYLFNSFPDYPFLKLKYQNRFVGAAFGYGRQLSRGKAGKWTTYLFSNISNEFLYRTKLAIQYFESGNANEEVTRRMLASFQNNAYQTRLLLGIGGHSSFPKKRLALHYNIYSQALVKVINEEFMRMPFGFGVTFGVTFNIK